MQGETVTAVSRRLLAQHGGLRGLFRLDIVEPAQLRGLGRLYGIGVPGGAVPGAGSAPSCTRNR